MKNFLLLLLLPVVGMAQNVSWSSFPNVTMPYNPTMIGYCVASDASLNSYWAGFKSQPFAYQDILGNQFLEKFDSEGNLIFSKEISGHAQTLELQVDSNQNIVLLLKFVTTMQIGNETFETDLQGEQNMLAKFDASGDLLWHDWLQPVEMDDGWYNQIAELHALILDDNDNIIIGYSDSFKSYLRKYDPSGNIVMEIEQDGVTRISSVSVDNEGNFYAAGSCVGPDSKFGGAVIEEPFFIYETYVVKYDATGQFQWVRFAEDITCSEAHVICKTPDDVYFLTPIFIGPFEFQGQTIQGSAGIVDFLLAKFNASGQLQWVRETPGSGGFGLGQRKPIQLDADGNIYVTGQAFGQTQWADGISTNPRNFMSQGTYLKYNSSGLVTSSGTVGADYARVDNMVVANGKITLAGMASGDLNCGDLTHNNNAGSDYYPYIIQLEDTSLTASEASLAGFQAFPNPAKNEIFLTLTSAAAQISIYNVMGQKVLQTFWEHGLGLNVSGLSSGPYFLKADEMPAIRFIKE